MKIRLTIRSALVVAVVVAVFCWFYAAPVAGYTTAQLDAWGGRYEYRFYGIYMEYDEDWARILKEKYEVDLRCAGGCVVSRWTEGFTHGYDSVIRSKLTAKFGRDVIHESLDLAVAECARRNTEYEKNQPNQPLQETPGTVPSSSTEPEARRH
jgi:hypothetical protein